MPSRIARHVTLLGAGAILTEVLTAAQHLAAEGTTCDVLSVISWSELARDGLACEERALQGVADAGAGASVLGRRRRIHAQVTSEGDHEIFDRG